MKKYFCDDTFFKRPPEKWTMLLGLVLPEANYGEANYGEINRLFKDAQVPAVLTEALVALPAKLPRVYKATHRFQLTELVRVYLQSKSYAGFVKELFEDPAFYHDDTLLLGTITHEGYVIMLLDEAERAMLNAQGYDFWCEWPMHDGM